MKDVAAQVVAYSAVGGGYLALVIAGTVLSEQSKYRVGVFAFLSLGLVFTIIQAQYSGIGADFVSGFLAGGATCVGIVFVVAARMQKGRRS